MKNSKTKTEGGRRRWGRKEEEEGGKTVVGGGGGGSPGMGLGTPNLQRKRKRKHGEQRVKEVED
ncbi:hypothetical protein Syun_028092 [Stephania yunnanensis]|uniref:Uncharacterized protein n=1 Tax=Stephania yunnanensis TaxID=152371 RepID=A0AAP0HQT7_9MAGN